MESIICNNCIVYLLCCLVFNSVISHLGINKKKQLLFYSKKNEPPDALLFFEWADDKGQVAFAFGWREAGLICGEDEKLMAHKQIWSRLHEKVYVTGVGAGGSVCPCRRILTYDWAHRHWVEGSPRACKTRASALAAISRWSYLGEPTGCLTTLYQWHNLSECVSCFLSRLLVLTTPKSLIHRRLFGFILMFSYVRQWCHSKSHCHFKSVDRASVPLCFTEATTLGRKQGDERVQGWRGEG